MDEFALAISVGLIILIIFEAIYSYMVYKKRRYYQKEVANEIKRREFHILIAELLELDSRVPASMKKED